jgi:CheY-like chemotaxis protein
MQTSVTQLKAGNFASAGLAPDGSLLWPQAPDIYPARPAPRGVPEAPGSTALQVLLVGARRPEQWLGSARLLTQPVSTQVAKDGAEALRLTGTKAFDIILIDVDTSVLDGLFLIARLRRAEAERPEGAPVPVLVYTAMHAPPFEAILRYRGVNDVLQKSASVQSIGECLQRWCPSRYRLAQC